MLARILGNFPEVSGECYQRFREIYSCLRHSYYASLQQKKPSRRANQVQLFYRTETIKQ